MIPQKVLNEIREMAIKAIQEYSESITMGTVDEDGNETDETMLPLIVMASEAFMIVATWAVVHEGRSLNAVEKMMVELGKSMPDYAMTAARKAKKADDNGEIETRTDDPFDVVDEIIKQAQKNADS